MGRITEVPRFRTRALLIHTSLKVGDLKILPHSLSLAADLTAFRTYDFSFFIMTLGLTGEPVSIPALGVFLKSSSRHRDGLDAQEVSDRASQGGCIADPVVVGEDLPWPALPDIF